MHSRRARLARAQVALAALVVVSTSLAGTSAARPGSPASPGRSAEARGLVFDGLEPAGRGSPCRAVGFEIHSPTGVTCTHGPDPAPAGVDVRASRSVAELRSEAPETAAAVPCFGDGTSGNRVQAIYAVATDATDRYAETAPLIRAWAAANVEFVVSASAAETGGQRSVRFVTDESCEISVDKVVLTAAGDDTFTNTANQLRAQGYDDPNRKYLVWTDADVYCGIAEVYEDDDSGGNNLNDGHPSVPGMIARIDSGCWGLEGDTPVEAHELTHNLGAVQTSAPNATSLNHCTDDYDVMCYDDDEKPATYPMQIACTDPAHERRLDCNHDDYFHTSPPGDSYLATHWNVADSSFLSSSAEACTHTGTEGGDRLVGTMGDDVLCGLGGNDTLIGRGGDDLIYGGNGFDYLDYSGAGATVTVDLAIDRATGPTVGRDTVAEIEGVLGTNYADTLVGDGGPDTLLGRGGNDTVDGAGGYDTLSGNDGRDDVAGGDGADGLSGGRGNDGLSGSSGRDHAYGGRGADYLMGRDGDDFLYGQAGNDGFEGGRGTDLCKQGAGFGPKASCEKS